MYALGAGATAWAGTAVDVGSPRLPSIGFADVTRSSGLQPLVLDATSHLRVQASIGGMAASVILDTGAARTIVDKTFAERLGLVARPGFNVAGVTGEAYGDFAEDVSISIGKLTLDHLDPGLLDLSFVSPAEAEPVAAIIGRELFQRTTADFDFAKSTVAFVDVAAPVDFPQHCTVSLGQTARGTPHVPISIGALAPIEAGLDIGYNASILLSPAYAERAGITRGRPVSTVASVGAEGVSVSRVATLDSLVLADTTLRDVPVEIPAGWNRSVPAIIGLDVIKKFRMLTDYPRRRIGLFEDPGEAGRPLPKDRSGIGAIPTLGGLAVIHVAAGSPAERSGLKAGDTIEAINGERVDVDYMRNHPRMGTRPAGTVFMLRLDGDRSRVVTLADYF